MVGSDGKPRNDRSSYSLVADIEELLDSRPDQIAPLSDQKAWLSRQVRVLEAVAEDSPEFAVKAYQYVAKVRGYRTVIGAGSVDWSDELTALDLEDRRELPPSVLDGRFVERLRRRAYAELIGSTRLHDQVRAARMDQRGTEMLIHALLIEYLAKAYLRTNRRLAYWTNLDVSKLVEDVIKRISE